MLAQQPDRLCSGIMADGQGAGMMSRKQFVDGLLAASEFSSFNPNIFMLFQLIFHCFNLLYMSRLTISKIH